MDKTSQPRPLEVSTLDVSPEEKPELSCKKGAPVVVTTVLMDDGKLKEELVSPLSPASKLGTSSSWDSVPAANAQETSTPRKQSFWRPWALDILFCFASLCSFVSKFTKHGGSLLALADPFYLVIVAVLGAYDGRSLPQMPMNITLNTFLAFFTTFTKAAFMTPISEALGQWKWNLFSPGSSNTRGRPLADFQVLDAASRGTWGSWMLLRNFKWRFVFAFHPQ
jgi:hypothetical protein